MQAFVHFSSFVLTVEKFELKFMLNLFVSKKVSLKSN